MRFETHSVPTDKEPVTVRCYLPDVSPAIDENVQRVALVICGGGGYRYVSPRESEPIALKFAGFGFNCYTVDYHVSPNRYPTAMHDIAAAVAFVRAHAEDHHTHPDKIALMGFSAGAHAACTVGVKWQDEDCFAPLGLTAEQVKPNMLMLCYPVITATEYAHRGSFEELTGSVNIADHQAYSLETKVTANTPETFIWHTWDDQAVPVMNSLLFASALAKEHISCEMHIYEHGSHGLSLCDITVSAQSKINPAWRDCAEWVDHARDFLMRRW